MGYRAHYIDILYTYRKQLNDQQLKEYIIIIIINLFGK